MPAITVDNPLVLPRLALPARSPSSGRSTGSSPPTTRSRAPASRCGGRSRAHRIARRRPVLPPRSARPGRVRTQRSRRRSVAPASGVRDRHLRDRRRRRAPRLQRRRRRHRRGRHAVDDRGRGHPARRGADGGVHANGGRTHGVQLWVNLPSSLKFTPPRYQAIEAADLCCSRPPTAARSCGSSPATSPATPAPGPPTPRSCTPTLA